ncbi:hypothetical protein K450DRAFT_240658 [Umbelopsis ramanniana AG]|uniref:C2H2-type domain-containing protein n=1 Tax=Umbelopsis ramanniana AG TaxID=1314678 RepID=A0AAD5EAU8_UMBRA|nr:uncharacterized protein K450DRAFT_240658 [Umbelopsis ramanniana AG]KAI8579859.1 hypothetical protein K450DRAFT_240658 [Umbelopsis ramanniana AG]
MADGEWHTVSRTNAPAAQKVEATSKKTNAHGRRSSHNQGHQHNWRQKPKSTAANGRSADQQQKSLHRSKDATMLNAAAPEFVPSGQKDHNPFDLPEDDDNDDDEEEDDGSPDPIDMPLPPYHTTIIVSCPFDNCSAVVPFSDTTSLVQHMKNEHQLGFRNIHHMYMALEAYLQKWAHIIREKDLKEYGVQETVDGKDIFVIDPEHCSTDKDIRDEMQKEKLAEVLKTQDRERHVDATIPRKCLFCKNVCDNRAALFKHMFAEHNFNIGLPDNLVNVNEFLDMLESKLANLQCLYCEKMFTAAVVLRKHMRKKKHFKIAPNNRLYDRFYVINFLEPGKNWENFENDRYESDEDRRDDSWADWDEKDAEPTMCLFDEVVVDTPELALLHMKEQHDFNLDKIRKDMGLDFYKTVTLINYIRHQSSFNRCYSCGTTTDAFSELSEHMQKNGCFNNVPSLDAEFWKDPKYLLPTYESDPLLTAIDDGEDNDDMDINLPDEEANQKYLQQAAAHAQKEK